MFKLGFGILFVVFFACDCFENLQAEDRPDKQEDANAVGRTDPMRHFENDDDGITDKDDVDNNDIGLSDVSHEQG